MVVLKRTTLIVAAVVTAVVLVAISIAVSVININYNSKSSSVAVLGGLISFAPIKQMASILHRPMVKWTMGVLFTGVILALIALAVYFFVIAPKLNVSDPDLIKDQEEQVGVDNEYIQNNVIIIGASLFAFVLIMIGGVSICNKRVKSSVQVQDQNVIVDSEEHRDKQVAAYQEQYAKMSRAECTQAILNNFEEMGEEKYFPFLPKLKPVLVKWIDNVYNEVTHDPLQQLYMIVAEFHHLKLLYMMNVDRFSAHFESALNHKDILLELQNILKKNFKIDTLAALLHSISKPADVTKFKAVPVDIVRQLVFKLRNLMKLFSENMLSLPLFVHKKRFLPLMEKASDQDLVEFAMATTDFDKIYKIQVQ